MANRREFLVRALLAIGAAAVHPLPGALQAVAGGYRLPKGCKFYEIGGQMLFPVYGINGGLCTMQICYIIKGHSVMAIPFRDEELWNLPPGEIEYHVAKKVDRYRRFGHFTHVDWNGGNFPKPEEI